MSAPRLHLQFAFPRHPNLTAFDHMSLCGFSTICRMALTVSFNVGAHGEIHELLGGSWSRNVTAYADRTDAIVQPFVHQAVVSAISLLLLLLLPSWIPLPCRPSSNFMVLGSDAD